MAQSVWEQAREAMQRIWRPGASVNAHSTVQDALSAGEALETEARRFYRADGSFEDLDPAEVIRRRKAAAVRIAELEREVAVTEHRRDRAVEQKEDAERVAEDARNDRDDARDRLEVAEAQVATLTRERDEARARSTMAFDWVQVLETQLTGFRAALEETVRRAGLTIAISGAGLPETRGALGAAIGECVRLAVDHVIEPARAALAPQAEKKDGK